jgi:heme/copper-type cytochrome/quinol oxidase subunit 2
MANAEGSVTYAVLGDDGVQRAEILAGSYFFKPNRIVVKVDLPVELSVRKKSGIVPHTIEINEPDLALEIKELLGTRPTVIRFMPGKTGSYEFYCAKKLLFFKGHREKGMEGVLEVVE